MGNKWKEIAAKFQGKNLGLKKNQLLIIFLAGILLVVIALPTSGSKNKSGKFLGSQTDSQTDTASGSSKTAGSSSESKSISDTESYQEYLESRLAKALESVSGVGQAEVVITLKSTGQKIVEKDQQSSTQTNDEEDSEGGTRSTNEQTSDKTSIYSQTSDGSQSPYVSKELTPEVQGVVVIADGGDNAVVIENITEAVQALFSVDAHKIKIMKRTDT